MSKVLAATMATAGATAVSVGGVYVIQKGSGNSTTVDGKAVQAKDEKVSNDLPAKSWQEFKAGNNSGECVTKYFEGFSFPTEDKSFSETNKVDSSYFSSSSNGSKSCLVLNWEKKGPATATGSKWSGTLKWVWSFVDGDKGFVMFTLIKPSATDATLELEGGIYVLDKSSGSWKVKGNKEIDSSNKTINSGNFTEIFPTVGNALGLSDESLKVNWGFIKEANNELTTLCKSGETTNCPPDSDSPKEFKGSWTWEKIGTGNERWSKWSGNMDTWIEKLYPNKDGLDLKGALGDSSSDSWTNPNLTKPSDNSVT